MQTITLGAVDITRVVEWHAPFVPAPVMFPDADPRMWRDNASWLAPDFWDPRTDQVIGNAQTWVLRSEGRTILVDTGLGNDKDRPGTPPWSGLRTDFLDRLLAAGVRPEDVDVVVNTHLHADHVGWNTRLVDGEWVPTFPNATYVIARADFDYWNPANGHPKRGALAGADAEGDHRLVFEDSVAPVHRAGRTVLWEGGYRIDGQLSLEPAPGHTPGSCVLRLESGSERALFIGDLVHSPLQIVEPDCDTCLSEDQAQATRSRRRILERAADTKALVFPAHLAGHGAAEVRREGGKFAISGWAPFERTG
ncbi:MBL fold metallo-hydrolase [Streptomyces griseocarneus]|uniref:MBL fold metallo-hydrolase n=1 Tax=Streptomyces griseocarneus TaxID=51201 RepID=UPI00167D5DC9|nr:MBL fold metallo-hydrolase [Streptomyces griseocarneus]MBZ6475936.1 MBL fold metallo-hydrolase [Streptomyces griseocarneus]GHG49942.1 MBL fold metallo-hydrolase [Streptomyces griseocarneus]